MTIIDFLFSFLLLLYKTALKMSWLFGNKNKNTTSSQTNLQAHRTKQIDSLKKANLNPIEVIPNTEYRITFVSGNSNITLVVTLPPLFPQDCPSISVHPPVYHQWVDSQSKIVNCPNLASFSMHSSLAVVVQSIIDEFKTHPPQPQSHNFGVIGPPPFPPATSSMTSYSGSPGLQGYHQSPVPQFGTSQSESMQVTGPSSEDGRYSDQVPDVFSAFPDLKTKSLTELYELQDEEDKILEMIQKLPEVGKFAEEREKISNECIELARNNLSYKPVLEQLRQWILEKNNLCDKTQEEFEQHQGRLMTRSEDFHPSVIQNNLKVALMEAEEESERIVEQFLEKKMDVEEFKQTFLQTRSLCHARRAKDEKLTQIILQHGYSN
ncbi:vacuolar protein sorting-associated protein 37A-like isoform X1 [Ostrea edulis]|uniref:vacuolar protein sorting-associated protein 37A-like isoform X1 n=1 Tax=Ostrea edulis TaxID=37623 RepID=UPI0020953B9A|nr:vacuolar protein sorting-associated protein 37A-like isoform X1 [Ostrea edulis]